MITEICLLSAFREKFRYYRTILRQGRIDAVLNSKYLRKMAAVLLLGLYYNGDGEQQH